MTNNPTLIERVLLNLEQSQEIERRILAIQDGQQVLIERQASRIKTLETQVASLMKLRHEDDVCPKCDGDKADWRKMCVNCAG